MSLKSIVLLAAGSPALMGAQLSNPLNEAAFEQRFAALETARTWSSRVLSRLKSTNRHGPIEICFGWAAALEGLTAKEPEKLLRIADIKAIVVAAS